MTGITPTSMPLKPSSRGAPARLEYQAAAAALHATQQGDAMKTANKVSLDGSATASLKYANPKDLPSFPSLGLSNGPSSAGAAASLASSLRKPIPGWKADPSPSAFAAAVHAKDLKSMESPQPEPSTQGLEAALVAHARNLVKPSPLGNPTSLPSTPLNQGLSPRPNSGHTVTGNEASLQTVIGVMGAKRLRSGSSPTTTKNTWPDLVGSAAALNTATTAHSHSVSRSGTLPHSAMGGNSRQGVGSTHILLKQETADGKRADVRAAAVSMTRKPSAVQQGSTNDTEGLEDSWRSLTAYRLSTCFPSGALDRSGEHVPVLSNKLQEAANKFAQDRLASLQGEHEAYRNYSGLSHTQLPPPIQDVTRRRAFSLRKSIAQDGEQSRPETPFPSDFTQADAEKQEKGRKALIATAQKNVQASMHKMDEKILSNRKAIPPDTGKKGSSGNRCRRGRKRD
ncbi:MAG: hypothetical protein M1840_000987 [Geoglossum simile]|nr:MAG: hypothetical protein M1840_000987 [Geoglossum simile]